MVAGWVVEGGEGSWAVAMLVAVDSPVASVTVGAVAAVARTALVVARGKVMTATEEAATAVVTVDSMVVGRMADRAAGSQAATTVSAATGG